MWCSLCQVSDIGHSYTPWEMHIKWCRALEAEFFKQGSLEMQENRPASPLMDPGKPGVTDPVNAVAFFNVVALPLIQAWGPIFQSSGHRLVTRATRNLQRWQSSIQAREPRQSETISPPAGRKRMSIDMNAWLAPASALRNGRAAVPTAHGHLPGHPEVAVTRAQKMSDSCPSIVIPSISLDDGFQRAPPTAGGLPSLIPEIPEAMQQAEDQAS